MADILAAFTERLCVLPLMSRHVICAENLRIAVRKKRVLLVPLPPPSPLCAPTPFAIVLTALHPLISALRPQRLLLEKACPAAATPRDCHLRLLALAGASPGESASVLTGAINSLANI